MLCHHLMRAALLQCHLLRVARWPATTTPHHPRSQGGGETRPHHRVHAATTWSRVLPHHPRGMMTRRHHGWPHERVARGRLVVHERVLLLLAQQHVVAGLLLLLLPLLLFQEVLDQQRLLLDTNRKKWVTNQRWTLQLAPRLKTSEYSDAEQS